MALSHLFENRKWLRLCAMLPDTPAPTLLGCLTYLWQGCWERLDERIGDALDVELAARWPGERGVLFKALVDCAGEGRPGFIEPDPAGGYRCHDLWDHAPRMYLQRRARLHKDEPAPDAPTTPLDDTGQRHPAPPGAERENPAPNRESENRNLESDSQRDSHRHERSLGSKESPPEPAPPPMNDVERAEIFGYLCMHIPNMGRKHPNGLTPVQVKHFIEAGMTMPQASAGCRAFEDKRRKGLVTPDNEGKLAYNTLLDQLPPDVQRELREKARSNKRAFEERQRGAACAGSP